MGARTPELHPMSLPSVRFRLAHRFTRCQSAGSSGKKTSRSPPEAGIRLDSPASHSTSRPLSKMKASATFPRQSNCSMPPATNLQKSRSSLRTIPAGRSISKSSLTSPDSPSFGYGPPSGRASRSKETMKPGPMRMSSTGKSGSSWPRGCHSGTPSFSFSSCAASRTSR